MLQVSNLNKRYGDAQILKNVSFTLNPGDRLGLIGPNGCGKTTLLRLVAGVEPPDSGAVHFTANGVRLGYLEQGLTYAPEATLSEALHLAADELELLEAQVAELATALATATGAEQARLLEEYGHALTRLEATAERETQEYTAQAVMAGLGLADLPLETPVAHLSGGQKTRLGLARLLLQNPQLLLLDEPTNHLDIQALEWLETWLQHYSGGVLLVSHDRALLDRSVTGILELDPTTHEVRPYPGNYSAYQAAKQREWERHWEAYTSQQERVAQLRGEARRLGNYANSIEAGTIDFGLRKIAKGIARRATVQKRRIERELAEETIEKPRQEWRLKLEFQDTPLSGQDVLSLNELTIGYGAAPLVQGITGWVRQGERVAIIGPNGCGKTTLLRTLTGQVSPLAGELRWGANVKIGYYAQEQEGLRPDSTPLDTIREVAALSDTEVRSFLHYFLFAGDDVFTPNRSLSYGERARLVLARLVASGCNCLLLDEPINHLDIPSRAQFEQAMSAFTGTVLAVVHDRYFLQQFASRLWVVAEGQMRAYVDWEDYRRTAKNASI